MPKKSNQKTIAVLQRVPAFLYAVIFISGLLYSLPHQVFAESASTSSAQIQTPTLDPHNSADVEARVRQFFSDVPAMAAVAKCESMFRQYDASGNVLYDPSFSMIGVFQISRIHLPEAIALGMDIMTLDGNLAYARHLYNESGMDPWMSSYGCWHNAATTQTATASNTQQLFNSLSFGETSADVVSLQKLLNQSGFMVAGAGPGSPGNETAMFGSLTRDAVRRFQCATMQICSGSETTTGYGLINQKTYNALVAAAKSPATAAAQQSSAQIAAVNTSVGSSADKSARIAAVESQIASLVSQLDTLNTQLTDLTK